MDLYEDSLSASDIRGGNISTWVLALATVCLRFLARRMSKAGFWYDDWLIIPAILFATVSCFLPVIWIESDFYHMNVAVFSSEICWAVAIWTVKYSILFFYWRLFSTNSRSIRILIWVLVTIVTCWGITVILLRFLQCSPFYYIWDDIVLGKCHYSTGWLFVGTWIPHIVTDIALLSFPIPLIWKFHMPRSHKIMLTTTFIVGGFVTIVSIIRLIYLVKGYGLSGNFTFRNYSYIFIWTSVEANVSIMCGYSLTPLACLPSLRPVLSFISEKLKLLRNLQRKRKSIHKRGSELLMDMLPTGTSSLPPILPSSKEHNQNDGRHPMLKQPASIEMEGINPKAPELDAEAPGPHIIEIGTLEPVLEMDARNPRAKA